MKATRFTLTLVVLVGLTFGGVGVAAADDDRHEKPKDHREKSKDHRFDKKDRKGDDSDRKRAEKRDRKKAEKRDRKRRKARKSARERTKRVVVCHVSKKKSETLEVSKRTAKKHLKDHKHDYLGPCDAKDRFDRKSHH